MIAVNEHACPQNHPCPAAGSCPVGAIIQDDVFAAPCIDHEICTQRGACTEVCAVFSRVPDEVAVH